MINLFVGYDSREIAAYHACVQSIIDTCTTPVSITPLSRKILGDIYRRNDNNQGSTEFTNARFFVPYLTAYSGWAIFMDCDMLVRSDLTELWELKNDNYRLMVCQHDYTPRKEKKFDSNPQFAYPRKNWSSLMLINCHRCNALTLDYLNTAQAKDLHRFNWIDGDNEIGSLPLSWNWLVGEYNHCPDAKIVHFTEGGPYFKEYASCDYSDEWFRYWEKANTPAIKQPTRCN